MQEGRQRERKTVFALNREMPPRTTQCNKYAGQKVGTELAVSIVKQIIKQLKNHEITVFEVPDEYKNNTDIAKFERKNGLRITGRRGFDVISDAFFVEEELCYTDGLGEPRKKSTKIRFEDFDAYFTFLDGDIYENACYAFHHISDEECQSRSIDPARLLERKAFVEKTVDDFSLSLSSEERKEYDTAKWVHKQCQKWIEKFNACECYADLLKVIRGFNKSKLSSWVDIGFFLFNYAFAGITDKNHFDTIMEYISTRPYSENMSINSLCLIYDPKEVLASFRYSGVTKKTEYRHRKALAKLVSQLESGDIVSKKRGYFDKDTHFYCESNFGFGKEYSFWLARTYRYFSTFEEFADYRHGDLTNCDLSSAYELDVDFSLYTVDETTKLPPTNNTKLNYSIRKGYDREGFYVSQQWKDSFGNVIKKYKHDFNYFFDFVVFLHGNMSDADLLFCDGLKNLRCWDGIDFSGARLTSELCQKFGLAYEHYELKTGLIASFETTEQNEAETVAALESSRDLIDEAYIHDLSELDIAFDHKCQRVSYISDLHLLHRIQNANCQSPEDVEYTVQKIVDNLSGETGRLLLVAGDVSSDFKLFELFVRTLYHAVDDNTMVVFVLGNHELWSFPGYPLEVIVEKYRRLLNEYDMYLLHNEVLYKEDTWYDDEAKEGTHIIPYSELLALEDNQFSERLRSSRFVILGGLGFSGYNMEFNADNGIYRDTIDRSTEIAESKKFEALYDRLMPVLCRKNTIVLTHSPKNDWCQSSEPDRNMVYVNGHTHRNYFFDDGEYRVYSDNQVGYHHDNPHLKSFLIDNEYDCFDDYSDGIFSISKEQYQDFYRGKNINMAFNREINDLYMLKRNGYYCFLHESKNGVLTILNGGQMRKLPVSSLRYVYEHMDSMITATKTPLDKYSACQKQIADLVKRIGGTGKIHGCIVDIDFCNHIYINPLDLTITGYSALDMIRKTVYPSIPALLEEQCPELYSKYLLLLKGDSEFPLVIRQATDVKTNPQVYLSTDIYTASREIKKMQKLYSNILSFWIETPQQPFAQIDRT